MQASGGTMLREEVRALVPVRISFGEVSTFASLTADDTVTDPKLAGRAALSAIVTPYGILGISQVALGLQLIADGLYFLFKKPR
jgi:hypothetical protein